LRHLAGGADARNRAGLDVGVPGASVGGDRQSERLVISPRGRQQLDAAAANAADSIGLIDGEPDCAVGGGCNRHWSIARTGHTVLDEARRRRRPPQQQYAGTAEHDEPERGANRQQAPA
jgi:hypothetical protein